MKKKNNNTKKKNNTKKENNRRTLGHSTLIKPTEPSTTGRTTMENSYRWVLVREKL
jgi:hypothetical protein|tara:strand:+ start:316 stop:483 length:168 start_codon:yes stop_codon:yes gene_type:complete